MKALRRAFVEDFGFTPPKTRRKVQPVRPKNVFQKVWWWLTGHRPTVLVTYPSTWRALKRAVKKADRG